MMANTVNPAATRARAMPRRSRSQSMCGKNRIRALLFSLVAFSDCLRSSQTHALVAETSRATNLEDTRRHLSQSFFSPSGKLTHAPEIVIEEPRDATSILLHATSVQQLSARLRACKANAAFVRSSVESLKLVCQEQESARGGFPGPVPIVYCAPLEKKDEEDGENAAAVRMSDVARAGADGVLVQVLGGKTIRSADDVSSSSSSSWLEAIREARESGLQAVPELVVGESAARDWTENDVAAAVDAVAECLRAVGGDDSSSPVCVVLTVHPESASEDASTEEKVPGAEPSPVAVPRIPKALVKRIPVVGSVRALAGDGRIGTEAARMKEAGFSSVLLRSDCLPGYNRQKRQLGLDIIGHFWASCIDDLKSVKSKSFSFRAKNNLEKSQGTVWANYQNSVIESGALGDPDDSYSIVDSAAGEYKGFA